MQRPHAINNCVFKNAFDKINTVVGARDGVVPGTHRRGVVNVLWGHPCYLDANEVVSDLGGLNSETSHP